MDQVVKHCRCEFFRGTPQCPLHGWTHKADMSISIGYNNQITGILDQ